MLALLGYLKIQKTRIRYTQYEEQQVLGGDDLAPGISIVAPAYNEEVIIIDSVNSLLNMNYPRFEVVIVNDGSVDQTLPLLINKFCLEKSEFPYVEKVFCQPVHTIYKSNNPKFHRLTVVDKINGGTKADAMNAGVNVAKYDYFINTDVDCLLSKDTLTKCILPVLDSKVTVIAVGATMRMVNGCDVKDGVIVRVRPPHQLIPLFQETEYLRSYLVAKMGWSTLNAIPNVSGGFGLFNKMVLISTGGFDSSSHAEDMDMTLRMVAFMREKKEPYLIAQIPDTCCWTEGPANLRVLRRQRTRWGRGLLQIFVVHRKFLFNPKYGRMGLVVLPYALFFEFLAPLIEATGFLFMLYLVFTEQINYQTFWLMLSFVYLIGVTVSVITISFDLSVKRQYHTIQEYLRLIFITSLEAIVYHPLIVIFSIQGYFQFLTQKNFTWGAMTRQGFRRTAEDQTPKIL